MTIDGRRSAADDHRMMVIDENEKGCADGCAPLLVFPISR